MLALSPARLIVIYGDLARNTLRAEFDYPDPGVLPARPVEVAGRIRRFAFLAHPAAANPRRPTELPPAELADAQRWLVDG